MTISQTLATSISGLNVNARKANVSAYNIVNQNTPGFKALEVRPVSVNTVPTASGGSGVIAQAFQTNQGVDLALEFTRLIEAQTAYKASVKAIQIAEEIERKTLDVLS
ncbi:MAG: hypothetical protein HQ512_13445 [Rhodospirillales bacterium]|nr:hypothetical protein [Rhodospirillales bacterium]